MYVHHNKFKASYDGLRKLYTFGSLEFFILHVFKVDDLESSQEFSCFLILFLLRVTSLRSVQDLIQIHLHNEPNSEPLLNCFVVTAKSCYVDCNRVSYKKQSAS